MECVHKIQLKNGNIVPCGKCYACLANQRQEWVFRLQQEFLDSAFSIFVTLTYDDDHLPEDHSVNKRDVQLFHKRLRKHFPSKDLRFYLVSEYGDHTFRPHYHGLYFFKSSYDRFFIYDIFEKSWEKGFCKFGEVEEGSIVYCTKYCLKHSHTPEGIKPTFRLVSKMNGGLGSYYLRKMGDYHISSENNIFVSHGGKTCRMPRYYRNKIGTFTDKYTIFNENLQEMSDKFTQSFKDFLSTRKFATFKEAVSAFEEYRKNINDTREQLVIKHCKKQKF